MTTDLAPLTKRTAEVLAFFTKEYLAAYIGAKTQVAVQNAVKVAKEEGMNVMPKEEKKVKEVDDIQGENKIEIDEGQVDLAVVDHHWKRDVGGSEFTLYDIIALNVHAGKSAMRLIQKRYRIIRRFHEDLEKYCKENKTNFPDLNFPSKKLFGNMDCDFIRQRKNDLNGYLNRLSKTNLVQLPLCQKTFQLKADPEAKMRKTLMIKAYNKTLSKFGIWTWDDPQDFDDEGEALKSVMIEICRRDFFPGLESKMYEIKVQAVRRKGIFTIRSTASQAVSKAIQTGWETSRGEFNNLIKTFEEKYSTVQSQIDDVIKNVVAKLIEALKDKLPKKEAKEDKKDENKEEKEVGFKTIKDLAITEPVFKSIVDNPLSTTEIEKFKKTIDEAFAFKTKMTTQIYRLSRDVSDSDLSWALYRLGDAVEGVLELFHRQLMSLVEGLVPFFKMRDELEPKFIQAASKGLDASKTEIKADLANANATLKAHLLELGKKMASKFNSHKNDLKWDLRSLPTSALTGSQILELVTILPERILNFLSYLRLHFISMAPTVFDKSTQSETSYSYIKTDLLTANFRKCFANSLTYVLDPLFEGIWNLLTIRLNTAIRLTFIDKLKAPVSSVVESLMESLQNLVPGPLGSMVNLPEMTDTVVETLLGTIADKTFAYYKKKIESHIFAEAEPQTKEEFEKAEEKVRKDKEEREKKKQEQEAFDNP